MTSQKMNLTRHTYIKHSGDFLALAITGVLILLLGLLTQFPAMAQPVTVGFITDESGVTNDWNALGYEGLLRAESELGVVGTLYTPTSSADYEPKLQQCVDDGNDLCISASFS